MAIVKFLLLGVAIGVVLADQSESSSSEEVAGAGKGRIDAPEVVLQLKYDRGELNRIYLTQFRKGEAVWTPSVAVKDNLCTDLCHAGLGGAPCGSSCGELVPEELHSVLTNTTEEAFGEITYGEPRVDVCPTLCENQLGYPLCDCSEYQIKPNTDWIVVCNAFCVTYDFMLRGCPSCEKSSIPHVHHIRGYTMRTLASSEGWSAWCNVQCRQGHGGAACNCDRAPL